MSEKWSSKLTLQFVEEYGKHACLWDIGNSEYKNKQSRDTALQAVVEAMDIEEFDISAVRKKIRIIRSTYWNECSKIIKSQKLGAGPDTLYKPKIIWFNTADQFLTKTINWKESSLNSRVHPGSSNAASQYVAEKRSCQKRSCQKRTCQKRTCQMPEEQEEPQKKICRQTSDHYTLQHNNHQTLVLESLAQDEMFMDLTLTSQGRAIKAHKSVLSAMSPYFRRVLNDNPCQHPIIVMPRDILFDELKNLITYIYKGEVTVPFGDVSSLLKTAHTLEITGLNEFESGNAKYMDTPLSKERSSQATGHRPRGPSGPPGRMMQETQASTSASSRPQELNDEANFVFVKEEFVEDWEAFPSNEPLTSKVVSCDSSGPPWPSSSQTETGDAGRVHPPTDSPRSSPPPPPSLKEDDKTASDNEDSCTIPNLSQIHPFVCCFCAQSYYSLEHLRSHLNLRHELLDWFLCECGVVVADESLLHTHKREYCNHPVAQSHK